MWILNNPWSRKLFCFMCTQGIYKRVLNVENWWFHLESSFGLCQYANKGQMSFVLPARKWSCRGGALKPTWIQITSGVKTINTTYVWHKTYIILVGNVGTFVIFYHPLLWPSKLFVVFYSNIFLLRIYFFELGFATF